MKIQLLAVAFLASAALVSNSEAGNHHGGGGGGGSSGAARSGAMRGGGGTSFHSMGARSFGGNRMMYSGQRFSGMGLRSQHVTGIRSRPINSNFGGQQFTGANVRTNRINQFGNNQQLGRNAQGFASNHAAIGNRTGQFRNAQGNHLAPNWRNHVVAQHSGNWHSNWDHHHSHWWHGHNWCWIGSSWFAFDVGFWPWWPWYWDYPYYGYGYGYPYNYGYGSGYGYDNSYGYDNGYTDPGVYDSQPYDNGYDNQSGYQNGYNNHSANSSVAAAQDRLVREGFYNGQIDGVLGPETRHALVRFQTKHGLRISGELTAETLDALGLREYANYGSN